MVVEVNFSNRTPISVNMVSEIKRTEKGILLIFSDGSRVSMNEPEITALVVTP